LNPDVYFFYHLLIVFGIYAIYDNDFSALLLILIHVAQTRQRQNGHCPQTREKFLKIHMARVSDTRVGYVLDTTWLYDTSAVLHSYTTSQFDCNFFVGSYHIQYMHIQHIFIIRLLWPVFCIWQYVFLEEKTFIGPADNC